MIKHEPDNQNSLNLAVFGKPKGRVGPPRLCEGEPLHIKICDPVCTVIWGTVEVTLKGRFKRAIRLAQLQGVRILVPVWLGQRNVRFSRGTAADLRYGTGIRAMSLPAMGKVRLGKTLLNGEDDLSVQSDLIKVVVESPEYTHNEFLRREVVPWLVLAQAVIRTARKNKCLVILPEELWPAYSPSAGFFLMEPGSANYFVARYAIGILSDLQARN